MASRSALLVTALVACAAWAPAASADDTTSGRDLPSGRALLALPILSDLRLARVEFQGIGGSASFGVDKVPEGRRVALVLAQPGAYRLAMVRFDNGAKRFWSANDPSPVRLELRADALNFAGTLSLTDRSGSTYARLDGDAFDELPRLLAASRDVDAGALERFPLVLAPPLVAGEVLGREPQPGWRYADWIAALPIGDRAEQRTVADRILRRFGATLPAHGAAWAEVRSALEGLEKRRALAFYDDDRAWIRIVLDGLWGERGQVLAFDLRFEGGRLASVAVRGVTGAQVWDMPRGDAWRDLADLAAQP